LIISRADAHGALTLLQELREDELMLLKSVNVACLRNFARFAKRFQFALATATMFEGVQAIMDNRYDKGHQLLTLAAAYAQAHCKESSLLIGLCHLHRGRLNAVPWMASERLAQSTALLAPIRTMQPTPAEDAAGKPSVPEKSSHAPGELRKQGTFHGIQAFQGGDLVPRLVLDFGSHELGIKALRGCVACIRFSWKLTSDEKLPANASKLGCTVFAPLVKTCAEFGGHILQLSSRQLVVLFLSDGPDTEHSDHAAVHAAALCCLNITTQLGSSQARS
jgi:hypothetical protein